MSSETITTIITSVISLVGIALTTRASMHDLTKEIEKNNVKQASDIDYIRADMIEVKHTLKEHNTYAAKFVEMQGQLNLMFNRIQVSEHRIEDLERMQIPSELKKYATKD